MSIGKEKSEFTNEEIVSSLNSILNRPYYEVYRVFHDFMVPIIVWARLTIYSSYPMDF